MKPSNGKKQKQTELDILKQKLHDNYIEQKRLISEINAIEKVCYTKKTLDANVFTKTEPIPECLVDLLGLGSKKKTRCEVLQLFYAYVEENDMIDKKKKNIINLPDELRQMFGMSEEEIMSMFNIQSYFRRLYEKPAEQILAVKAKTKFVEV
jgi:hypothetical protein